MLLVHVLQVKYVQGLRFFHLWEVVQIFERESIFFGKISSGGPDLSKNSFREELILGGPFLP